MRTSLVAGARRVVRQAAVTRARRLVGRAVTPQVGLLTEEVGRLYASHAILVADVERLERERDALRAHVERLDADLDEARRLTVRIAELTDLVTEVVLPLHDREIDARKLRPHDVEPQ